MCNKIEIIFIAETSICLKIKRRSQHTEAAGCSSLLAAGCWPNGFHVLAMCTRSHSWRQGTVTCLSPTQIPQLRSLLLLLLLLLRCRQIHLAEQNRPVRSRKKKIRVRWMDIDLNRYFAVELIWRKINLPQVNNPFVFTHSLDGIWKYIHLCTNFPIFGFSLHTC